MYAACVGISGYVPLPLTGDDYIELLPAVFRTVNDYGLTIDSRTYDCKALNPYRRLDSGLRSGNKQWDVDYDPYDITLVWLRDHRSDEWITVPWVYRSLAGQPFGLALWEHARRVTTERSGARPAEADVATNVADLIAVIEHGQLNECGTHRELMTVRGLYAELFTLQARAYR
jgi:putative transposase